MALSHSIPDHRFPADARDVRRSLTFAPPREPFAAAAPFVDTAKIPTAIRRPRGSARGERYGIFILVAAAHIAGAVGFARFPPAPPEPPQKPIAVSLIAPPAVVTAPEPPPAPPPPQPEVRDEPPPKPVVKPQPPKPVVKAEQPKPKPKPAPAREPVVESPTALTSDAPEPEPAPVEPAPPVAVAPARTPAPAPAAAPAPEVTAARFDAAYLNNPPPAYPPLSRRMREEGKVMLRVFVTAEGAAGKIELADSSGSSRLDAAAEKAVARWRFIAARQDGRSVAAWVVVPIVFKLEG